MLVIASASVQFTVGLLITFLGIGLIANVLIGYAVAQVFGERRENAEAREHDLGS